MIAIDRPNTFIVSPGFERRRLFLPFRYKQDDAGMDGLFESEEFQEYKERCGMSFEVRFRNYPIMI